MTALDPHRLRRALFLTVTPAEPGAWDVHGGSEPHRVTERQGRLDCDCADRRIRGAGCKHLLAVMLSRGHPATLDGHRGLMREATA